MINNSPGFNNNEKKLSSLEKNLEALAKSNANTNAILSNFIQTIGQLINTNTQAIVCLKILVGQLASIMNEQERDRLPSQSEPNPKNQNSP